MTMRLESLRADLESSPTLGPIDLRLPTASSDAIGSEVDITDVVHDSRAARRGALFCAVRGQTFDGHRYADSAIERGAVALLVERWLEVELPQLRVPDVRVAMPLAASIVHGHPSRELAVFGITGTNGKTTTTHLLADILRRGGFTTEVIGTLAGVHTTPEGTDFQRRLRRAVEAGVDIVAAEVSSHALDQHRVDGTEFAVAAFTNLSEDHLDYHRDLETYFEAKSRLFDGRAARELINVDDPWGARLADLRPHCDRVSVASIEIDAASVEGTSFTWRGRRCFVPLPGAMNVANALMALEAAVVLGASEDDASAGLGDSEPVPGRMQVVDTPAPADVTVVVDYSHTPAGIEQALATLREVAPGHGLHIVFGCGGDRDRTKRPLMARAAEVGADRVIVTSDNPRSEDPLAIIEEALGGLERRDEVVVEPDRRAAIRTAIGSAAPGDIVLIAGKGHETTQTIGDQVLPFDDAAVAAEILAEVGS